MAQDFGTAARRRLKGYDPAVKAERREFRAERDRYYSRLNEYLKRVRPEYDGSRIKSEPVVDAFFDPKTTMNAQRAPWRGRKLGTAKGAVKT